MAFVFALDPTTPSGGEAASLGDDRIREFKNAVIERLQQLVTDYTTDPYRLQVTSTVAPQATVRYDALNHVTISVSSAGVITYNATGASAGHSFSDAVTVTAGGLTVSAGTTAVQALTATTGTFSSRVDSEIWRGIAGAGNMTIENNAGTALVTIAKSTGATTFTNAITATTGTFAATGALIVRSFAGDAAPYIRILNGTGGVAHKNWRIIKSSTVANALELEPSVTDDAEDWNGGRFILTNGGALTLSGAVQGASITSLSFVRAAATNSISWNGRTALVSPGDGVLTISNNAATDFNRLQFGGTSNLFPSLKRSTTAIHVMLADDSGFASFKCSGFDATAGATFAAGLLVSAGTTAVQALTATTGTFSSNVSLVNLTATTGTFSSDVSLVNLTATTAYVSASGTLGFTGRSYIQSDGDGNLNFFNAAGTSFGLVKLGGGTASFPAFKRSSTTLVARLADDSADAPFQAAAITASNGLTVSSGTSALQALTATTGTFSGDIAASKHLVDGISGDDYMTQSTGGQINFVAAGTERFRVTSVVALPNHSTTAVAANAVIDGGGTNELRRSTSSIRYKDNLEDLTFEEAAAFIFGLKPVTYTSKIDRDREARHVGFIAEDVVKLDPRFVTRDEDGTPNYVTYDRLIAPMALVVQDHEQRLRVLEGNFHA